MGNNTTVTTVSVGGACSVIVTGLVNYFQPDLIGGIPGFEAAVAVVLTAAISYLTPCKRDQ